MVNFEAVKDVFIKMGFEPEEISKETNIVEDLNLDSTEMADLYSSLKRKFKVNINPIELSTVDRLVKYIQETVAK